MQNCFASLYEGTWRTGGVNSPVLITSLEEVSNQFYPRLFWYREKNPRYPLNL